MHHTPSLEPHGLRLSQQCRNWAGVTVVSESWRLPARTVLHEFPARPGLLLAGIVQSRGGAPQPRLAPQRSESRRFDAGDLHLVDAHSGLWGFSNTVTYVRDIALCFDIAAVQALLHDDCDPQQWRAPRLGCADDLLSELIRLLADALAAPDQSGPLYGEGLICAAFARLFARRSWQRPPAAALSRGQLAMATDLLAATQAQPIGLRELADRLDLPAAYLAQAFKARTSVTLHQWQLRQRLQQPRHAWRSSPAPAERAWSRLNAMLKTLLSPGRRPWRQLRNAPGLPSNRRTRRYRRTDP